MPILGDSLTGGKGEGIFGLTYAPGILRKFFEYGNDGQPIRRRERNN